MSNTYFEIAGKDGKGSVSLTAYCGKDDLPVQLTLAYKEDHVCLTQQQCVELAYQLLRRAHVSATD